MIEHKSKHLVRRHRLHKSLQNIGTTPLVVLFAAIGYGKTTAITCFMEEQTHVRFAYVPITHETHKAELIWKRITNQIHTLDPATGKVLEEIAFPRNSQERETCAEVIATLLHDRPLVLVLDDYHFIKSDTFDSFISFLAQYPDTGLHLVLLSRRRVKLPVDELVLKGYCTVISTKSFQFSEEETRQYVASHRLSLSCEQSQALWTMSEGWITAIQLMIKQYKRTGVLGQSKVLYNLIASSEIHRFSDHQLYLLKQLSHLEEYSASLASKVLGVSITPYMLEQIEQESSFIEHVLPFGTYRLHPVFRQFLNHAYTEDQYMRTTKDQKSPILDKETIFLRAGLWYLASQNPLRGFDYLLKAHAYDAIMEEFAKFSNNRFLDAEPSFIVSLFSAIPKEVYERHLYTWLSYIGFYCTNVDMQAVDRLLNEFEEVVDSKRNELNSDEMRSIEGEVALIRAYEEFNDTERMSVALYKAHRLLNGRSRVADKDKIITFGSPHALFLYHSKKGSLEKTMKTVQQMFPCYHELTGGCGKGFDDLLSAELFLERGELQKAQLYAYRAFYKAASLDQYEVMLSSQFTLARISMAMGDIQEVYSIIESQRDKIAATQNPILQTSFDLSVAYLASQLNNSECIANWIQNGQIACTPLLYHGQGFIFLVYGKYLLMQKSYIQLEVLCEQMKEIMSRFSNQLGYLHGYIQESAAKYQLYDLQSAEKPLLRALEIGFADDLIVPFAEYGAYIMDILLDIKKRQQSGKFFFQGIPNIAFSLYLDKVVALVLDYFTSMKDCLDDAETLILLNEREQRILKLIAQGKTNKVIASQLFVAEVTVRKQLTALYKKLNVKGRAEAVRRALELGIV